MAGLTRNIFVILVLCLSTSATALRWKRDIDRSPPSRSLGQVAANRNGLATSKIETKEMIEMAKSAEGWSKPDDMAELIGTENKAQSAVEEQEELADEDEEQDRDESEEEMGTELEDDEEVADEDEELDRDESDAEMDGEVEDNAELADEDEVQDRGESEEDEQIDTVMESDEEFADEDEEQYGNASLAQVQVSSTTGECKSWCEADRGVQGDRHCAPGNMANLCGSCSYCSSSSQPRRRRSSTRRRRRRSSTTRRRRRSSTMRRRRRSSSSGGKAQITFYEWNVYYKNKDTGKIADIIKTKRPDIIGLCEFTGSMSGMANSLSSKISGASYREQPGRSGWKGYGTDIFYNSNKFSALDGGVEKVSCSGTRGGDRAANWAVLKHKSSGKTIITGGIHLSYCSGGCDSTQECELGKLYSKLNAMKRKYPSGVVVWMGDMNLGVGSRVLRNQMSKSPRVVDLSKAQGQTHMEGGVIDHIFGESKCSRLSGGRTGQGTPRQWLNGADHFPVYATVRC